MIKIPALFDFTLKDCVEFYRNGFTLVINDGKISYITVEEEDTNESNRKV